MTIHAYLCCMCRVLCHPSSTQLKISCLYQELCHPASAQMKIVPRVNSCLYYSTCLQWMCKHSIHKSSVSSTCQRGHKFNSAKWQPTWNCKINADFEHKCTYTGSYLPYMQAISQSATLLPLQHALLKYMRPISVRHSCSSSTNISCWKHQDDHWSVSDRVC